jgi:hypothetical protein
VLLRSASGAYPSEIAGAYLQLPAALPQRVRDLARRVAADSTTAFDKAVRIQDYLRLSYEYDLEVPPPPGGQDAVDYFRSTHSGGFCSLFLCHGGHARSQWRRGSQAAPPQLRFHPARLPGNAFECTCLGKCIFRVTAGSTRADGEPERIQYETQAGSAGQVNQPLPPPHPPAPAPGWGWPGGHGCGGARSPDWAGLGMSETGTLPRPPGRTALPAAAPAAGLGRPGCSSQHHRGRIPAGQCSHHEEARGAAGAGAGHRLYHRPFTARTRPAMRNNRPAAGRARLERFAGCFSKNLAIHTRRRITSQRTQLRPRFGGIQRLVRLAQQIVQGEVAQVRCHRR